MFGHVDGNGEPNADKSALTLRAAPTAQNGGIDAHHLALDVHKGAAGIPRIDRRVRLDKVLNLFNASF